MTVSLRQRPYECDQCGNTDFVAAPLLYQQGTHSYSSMFTRGVSQSVSALAASPPQPKGYLRPLLLWGFAIFFALFWGFAGLGSILRHQKSSASLGNAVTAFLVLGIIFMIGLALNIRRVFRYNHEVYPGLYGEWTHTYMCRRCGRFQVIFS
jgi:hypothetical protein